MIASSKDSLEMGECEAPLLYGTNSS